MSKLTNGNMEILATILLPNLAISHLVFMNEKSRDHQSDPLKICQENKNSQSSLKERHYLC